VNEGTGVLIVFGIAGLVILAILAGAALWDWFRDERKVDPWEH
jgi:hypothetical protein